jgi:hypothetical protein
VLSEGNDGNSVMTGLVPVIHVVQPPETLGVAGNGAAWMAGTSPAMSASVMSLCQEGESPSHVKSWHMKPKATASQRCGVESSRRRTNSLQDDESVSAGWCGEPPHVWRSLGRKTRRVR